VWQTVAEHTEEIFDIYSEFEIQIGALQKVLQMLEHNIQNRFTCMGSREVYGGQV
jgi:hypothetical protein